VLLVSNACFRVAAEADARSAIEAGPSHFAAFKALAVALGKKSKYGLFATLFADPSII